MNWFHYIRDADLRPQLGASARFQPMQELAQSTWCTQTMLVPKAFKWFVENHDIALIFLDTPVDHPYAYLLRRVSTNRGRYGCHHRRLGQQTSSQQPEPGTVQ